MRQLWRKIFWYREGRQSAPDAPNRGVQLFIARVGVDSRGERARMPGEPLGEVEIPCCPVDVRDGRMSERVERIDRLESRGSLPFPEYKLDPPER
jgi:hypothetical protein